MALPLVNLLDLDAAGLAAYCSALGEKPFRARQLQRWIHQAGVRDFDKMTDLAKSLREKLAMHSRIDAPEVISGHTSADGTCKWLMGVGEGNAVETVFIPEPGRGTLCVSSQAGCAVNCRFCATGKQGFNRNLTTAEIIGQLWIAEFSLRAARNGYVERGFTDRTVAPLRWQGAPTQTDHQYGKGRCADQRCGETVLTEQAERVITNIVMMGMGEPLLNFDAVVAAMRVMLDDNAYGLSRRRLTLSTSGVVPMIDRLASELPVALAVSLHAPNDALRDVLVPLNKKYPLRELMAACQRYLNVAPRNFITFEYCMLDGVNDSVAHARELIALTHDLPCKFNLIPFNSFPQSGLTCSSVEQIKRFAQTLLSAGRQTTVRKTRGDDIEAACGQLAGQVKDRTRLAQRRASTGARPIIALHPG